MIIEIKQSVKATTKTKPTNVKCMLDSAVIDITDKLSMVRFFSSKAHFNRQIK